MIDNIDYNDPSKDHQKNVQKYSDALILWVHEITSKIDRKILSPEFRGHLDEASISRINSFGGMDFVAAMLLHKGALGIYSEISSIVSNSGKEDPQRQIRSYISNQYELTKRNEDWLLGFIPLIYGWSADGEQPICSPEQLNLIRPAFLEVCDNYRISPHYLRDKFMIEVEANQSMKVFIKAPVMQIYDELHDHNSESYIRLQALLDEKQKIQQVENKPSRTRVKSRFKLKRGHASLMISILIVLISDVTRGFMVLAFPLFIMGAFLVVDTILEIFWKD